MGGEGRAKRRIKDRRGVNPTDDANTGGSTDETRMYAKLILSKVRKLELEVTALSLKCSEQGSTSGGVKVVDLEAEEEEDNGGGGGNHGREQEHANDGSRFKKEMEENSRKVHGEVVTLWKLTESLVEHVKETGTESKSSSRTPACGSADETRMYAKLIMSKVKKLKGELAALSVKFSEPGLGSTSVKVEVVDLEAEEEENAGRGSHNLGCEHGSVSLSWFKKEMGKDCGSIHGEVVTLCKLVESLVEHVKEPGSGSTGSEPKSSSSSNPREAPSNDFENVADDDSKSELKMEEVDKQPTSNAGLSLIKRRKDKKKKAKIGVGRPKSGPSTSTFGGVVNDEEQQGLTEGESNASTSGMPIDGDHDEDLMMMNLGIQPQPVPDIASASSSTSTPRTACSPRQITQRRKKNTRACNLECIFCQKKFTANSKLELHILRHIGERPHFCTLCSYECNDKGNLKNHLLTHKPVQVRGFQCDLCQKFFSVKRNLTVHIEGVHEKKRPFKCDECHQAFQTKGNLQRHKLVHTGEKKHCCGICDMKFAHKHTLESHIRTHTGERPYSCPFCSKTFKGLSDQRRHEQTHQK